MKKNKLPKKNLDIRFIILVSFLSTFILWRIVVYFFVLGPPRIHVNINGTHVHHLTLGIMILAVIGYVSLTTHSNHFKKFMAVLYGIGLATAFDEFGMWLHLKDDYWIRHSYDAILVITIFLINTAFFRKFWYQSVNYLLRKKKKVFYLLLIKLMLSTAVFYYIKLKG